MLVPFILAIFLAQSHADDFADTLSAEEIRDCINKQMKVESWQEGKDESNYNNMFTVRLDSTDVKEVQRINVTDPSMESECAKVEGYAVTCPDCTECQRRFASYDSCGLMTGRACCDVIIKKDSAEQYCQRQALQQHNNQKCSETVKKEVDETCTTYECKPIEAAKCDAIFPKVSKEECIEKLKLPSQCQEHVHVKLNGTVCDANCRQYKCELTIPQPQCHDYKVEGSDARLCRAATKPDECGAVKCELVDEINLDEAGLVIVGNTVKCKDQCKVPKVVGPLGDESCAKEIKCEQECNTNTNLKCPQPGQPNCFTTIQATNMTTDDCGCARVICKPHCPISKVTTCPNGKEPGRSKVGEQCCDYDDTCKCEQGKGDVCCVGDACGPQCKDESTCCEKDDQGCFIHGKSCHLTALPGGPKVITEETNCSPCKGTFQPKPKAKPLCCAGPFCNNTHCDTLQQCCKRDECCAIFSRENNQYIFVGENCPPTCNSAEPPCRDCYIIKQKDSGIMSCPAGKCCCTNGLDLVVKDCSTIPRCKESPCKNCSTIGTINKYENCPAGKCCCIEESNLVIKDCKCETSPYEDCKIINTISNSGIESCPADKSCCTEGSDLVVKDCKCEQSPHKDCKTITTINNSGIESCPAERKCCTEGKNLAIKDCCTQGNSNDCTCENSPFKDCNTTNTINNSGIESCPAKASCCTTGLDLEVKNCTIIPPVVKCEVSPCKDCNNKTTVDIIGSKSCPAGECCCIEGEKLIVKDCKCQETLHKDCNSISIINNSGMIRCPADKSCCTEGQNLVVKDCTPPFPKCEESCKDCNVINTIKDYGSKSCPAGKCCCTEGRTMVVKDCSNPSTCSCKLLNDANSKGTCCWNVTIGGELCPVGKACCNDNGSLRIIGTHCCKGDGCCALIGGQRDCCNDRSSCCGTGCHKHCKMIKGDGTGGFLDHFARNLEGDGACPCRESKTDEECEAMKDDKNCFTTKEEICNKSCTRTVCHKETCPNTLRAWVRHYIHA